MKVYHSNLCCKLKPVRETNAFCLWNHFMYVEIDHFYQDRLGINTGQAETNARFSAGARGFLPVRDV
jgi:hypothetical protein